MLSRVRLLALSGVVLPLSLPLPAAAQVTTVPPEASAVPAPIVVPLPTVTPVTPPVVAAPRVVPTPRATPTPTPTPTPRIVVRATPTPTPVASPTIVPRVTPTPTPVVLPTSEASAVPPVSPVSPSTPMVVAPVADAPTRGWLPVAGIAGFVLLGGWWWWRRRERAEDEPIAAVASAPLAAPPPAPAPPRAGVEVVLRPRRGGVNMLTATLDAEIVVRNVGATAIGDVRVSARLLSAGGAQDEAVAAFLAAPDVRPAATPFALAAGEERRVGVLLSLGRADIHVLTASGRPMFVPVAAVGIGYRDGGDTAQAGYAFAIGVEQDGAAKLAPFWLDAPGRMQERLAARVIRRM